LRCGGYWKQIFRAHTETAADTMSLTLWGPVNWQQLEKVSKEESLSSYFAMHTFLGLLPLSFASRNARQADPSSYRFPDGTTMVKTEDGFNVRLGSLLDG
jgi:hypothetical protein